MARTTIAVDIMGSDNTEEIIEGICNGAVAHDVDVLMVGDPDVIRLDYRSDEVRNRVTVVPETAFVSMDVHFDRRLLRQPSSMKTTIELGIRGEADAIISFGNTGFQLGFAQLYAKTIPGIDRPALTTIMPGDVVMLDVGANVTCTPHQLYQFAHMGKLISELVLGIQQPTVGLLSIASEPNKGKESVIDTYKLLQSSKLNLLPENIEPNHILENFRAQMLGIDTPKLAADVVVSDGNDGNLVLKAIEGVGSTLFEVIKHKITQTWWQKLAARMLQPSLREIKEPIDWRNVGGAFFVGEEFIWVKGHGRSERVAATSAIRFANRMVTARLTPELKVLGDGWQTKRPA